LHRRRGADKPPVSRRTKGRSFDQRGLLIVEHAVRTSTGFSDPPHWEIPESERAPVIASALAAIRADFPGFG